MIDTNTTEEQLGQGFVIAVTVWNAFVFDKARDSTKYRDMLSHALGDAWTSWPVLEHSLNAGKGVSRTTCGPSVITEFISQTASFECGPRHEVPTSHR
jgi:hypothetical protein